MRTSSLIIKRWQKIPGTQIEIRVIFHLGKKCQRFVIQAHELLDILPYYVPPLSPFKDFVVVVVFVVVNKHIGHFCHVCQGG